MPAGAGAAGLGGAAAIGTTPLLVVPADAGKLVGVLPAVERPSAEPCSDGGDSEFVALRALAEVGVTEGVCWMEFLRDTFFDDLAAETPTGRLFPLPRFRFLITSVLRERGRTTP